MNRRRAGFFLFLFLSLFLWSEDSSWTCAVTAFSGTLEEESHFLFRQIPLQIYHRVSPYPKHILSQEEILFEREEELDSARMELLDAWESLHTQRDALVFSEDPIKYESLTEEIEEKRREYEQEGIPGAEALILRPITFLTPGSGGILFSSPEDALGKNPDFLISGTMDDAGAFFLIELTGLYVAEGREVSLWVGAGKSEDLDRLVNEMTDALKGVLLGREWSALAVTADPGRAQIFLDGVSLGVGAVEEEILEPGPAVLEIRYPRYGIYREEILLSPGERLVRNITLEKGEEELVAIETEPAGADVILGSEYRGQTPLILPRPFNSEKLILSLDGYDTLSADLGPDSPDQLHFSLTAGGVDWEEGRLAAKDKFYNSLGWFSISLAGPLILNGIVENQSQLANSLYSSGDMDGYADAYNTAYYTSGVFWGSMAVSGALLGVSITRLVQYIKASEKSIEQR